MQNYYVAGAVVFVQVVVSEAVHSPIMWSRKRFDISESVYCRPGLARRLAIKVLSHAQVT